MTTMTVSTKTAAFGKIFALVLLICCCLSRQAYGFAVAPALPFKQHGAITTTTKMWFKNEVARRTAPATSKPSRQPKIRKESVEDIIRDLDSADELVSFLQTPGENRPAVVFYYAGWCKNCQRVGLHLQKVARKLGTTKGPVRFASMECKPSTQDFILNQMCVTGLPALRVYDHDGDVIVDAGGSVRDLAVGLAGILRDGSSDRETPAASAAMHEQLQLSLGVAAL